MESNKITQSIFSGFVFAIIFIALASFFEFEFIQPITAKNILLKIFIGWFAYSALHFFFDKILQNFFHKKS